ncbi:MAG: hypothetical protein DWQ37_22690 [Planctomycetota bacterium]|nr:MAG: hypothetical protein DWQ37_22690 [Planctomycetota bacterium]
MAELGVLFSIFVGLAVLAVVIAGPVILLVFLLKSMGGGTGSWTRLQQVYATNDPPRGDVRSWQSVRVGSVNYNNIATLGIAEEGLYVSIWRSTALVPWNEFHGQDGTTLTVGNPPVATIRLSRAVLEALRNRLPQQAPVIE